MKQTSLTSPKNTVTIANRELNQAEPFTTIDDLVRDAEKLSSGLKRLGGCMGVAPAGAGA